MADQDDRVYGYSKKNDQNNHNNGLSKQLGLPDRTDDIQKVKGARDIQNAKQRMEDKDGDE